jgi:amino acid transporter
MAETGTARRAPQTSPRPGAGRILKRIVLGRAKSTHKLEHTLLPKFLALPVFSSDPMSSVAYATEQALLVLVMASLSARRLVMPIALAIATVMALVIASYRQTVRAYPSAAGSYVVSRENLGTLPSLVAGAALLTDYVLTVAVSVVAGVFAITSAIPTLGGQRVALSLLFVAFIAAANLRGLRESGLLFALPTYGFIASVFAMIATGLVKCLAGCPQAVVPEPIPVGMGAVTLFVVLHAFASGSTALTGIEAISDGISAFRRPRARNAAQTLLIMGVIAITSFLGVSFLALHSGSRPSEEMSVISQIARAVFPGGSPESGGPMFYVVQGFTVAILVLAANTAYQDFPRLSMILARDRFMPRQFENLGDRLVFSNGVLVLTVLSSALIVAFRADVETLVQLYVVGVFTAFTLSQTGMVRHWLRVSREEGEAARGWRRRLAINVVGASATGLVLIIVIITKFVHGAWIVMVAVPLFVAMFLAIHRHYGEVARQVRQGWVPVLKSPPRNTVVLYVQDLDVATTKAVGYVRSFSRSDLRALHVVREQEPVDLRAGWPWFSRSGVELDVVPSEGDPAEAVIRYVRSIPRGPHDFVTVVVPEQFRRPSLVAALRSGTAFALKVRLLREPGVAIANVPVLLGEGAPPVDPRPLVPTETVALVLISGVHDATVAAVNYARSLDAAETRAVFFSLAPREEEEVLRQWGELRIPVQLDVVGAPFRDLGPPILEEIRRVTRRPGAVAAVVIPELIVARRLHHVLHNQRALFIKRLLLFEPGVVLTSVPYRLGAEPGGHARARLETVPLPGGAGPRS